MTNPEVDADGTKVWKNKEGQLHREDGPAVEYQNGTQVWCINNEYHRDNGPAMIFTYSPMTGKEQKTWWYEGILY